MKMHYDPVTCPDGVVNSMEHILNRADTQCVPFTVLQLSLFAVGCLMWVVAYGIIIRNGFRFKTIDMAALAVFSNFGWETVWSWFFRTDMGWFLQATYRAWWFPDIIIVYLTFKYGHKQYPAGSFMNRHFTAVGVFWLIGFTLLYYFFTAQGLDTSIGATSAYLCQFLLSYLCLVNLLQQADEAKSFSFNVAWLKAYGTGMNTVFMFIHYPQNHLVHTCGVLAFLCDNFYIYTLYKRKKAQGLPLFFPVPAAATKGG
jgi:hypothetical protein